MRVLFWGTPDFAAPALRALLGEGFDVVGVITRTDKPRGRSRSSVVPSPVKTIALEESLPVLQPESARAAGLADQLRELSPDISVVVAYGHVLPVAIIELPSRGTINIHASLLPALRGAAPIQAAIREGMSETGISIMRMVKALDAGPVIHQLRIPIVEDETYGELQSRLSELGAMALIEAMALLDIGAASETPQDDAAATYAPKIARAMAMIDWSRPAIDVSRIIRAYDPQPGAYTRFRGSDLKLFGAQLATPTERRDPGAVLDVASSGLVVACGGGTAVRVSVAQPSGKPRMAVDAWARGRGIAAGAMLGD